MKTLLSIDDEPAMLRCLANALKGKGYDLLTTSDPEEGLKILRERDDIKLLLLDVRMPKRSGLDVYKEIGVSKKIPVLFVTAHPGAFSAKSNDFVEIWRSQFAEGSTDILYKPFNLDALFEKVEGLIGEA